MKRFTALLVVLMLSLSLCFTAFAADDSFALIEELNELIRDYSLEYRDKETEPLLDALARLLEKDPALFDKLTEEMMSSLDKYSHYMTAEEYNTAFPMGTAYVGVGIIVDSSYPFGVVVDGLVEGGSAAESGILPNDVIVSVDGKNIELLEYPEAVSMLRGEEGSIVEVQVRRQGYDELLTFKLNRRGLSVPNVTYENKGNGVGLITISRFDSIMDFFEFVDIYNGIPYDDGIKSVIIDLRGNPGGDVAVTYNMLNYMVREEDIPLFELVNSEEDEIYYSSGAGVWTPNALLILINGNSASASEIFAGSLQALGYAQLVGQKTYGKGRSQYHFQMSDNSVAIITAYEILLPEGKAYESEGVMPDYEVKQASVPYPMPKMSYLNDDVDIKRSKKFSAQVFALQQRLYELGIFPGTPDGIYGDLTAWSVNVFQKSMELPVRKYADKATLKAINAEIELLGAATITMDSQMEAAIKIAEEAAAKPWTNPPEVIETLSAD